MRIQMATKSSKKYKGVYCDNKGKIFYQIDLGIDPVTGKRVQKKARKNQYGKTFETMKEAYDELVRIKYEFANKVSLENYNMTFENYMNKIYLRAYKQKVQSVTYKTALPHHKLFIQYFGLKPLKAITPRDCEAFRLHIIENYSENYAKNLWSRFKACMGYAERLGYISNMPCKALDNPRGKHPETPFWTYAEFQTFIKSFDLHDYEELQRFTAIWLYYMTGVRVSEGLSLCWEDIDFDKKFLKVHTTLEKDEMVIGIVKTKQRLQQVNDLLNWMILLLKYFKFGEKISLQIKIQILSFQDLEILFANQPFVASSNGKLNR